MAKKHHRRTRLMSEINVVPYIDVMLVLLVIFMITAPLLAEGVKVSLPEAPAKPLTEEQQDPLVVVIDAQGQMFLNYGDQRDVPLEPDVLAARVAAILRLRPRTPVIVKGDKAVAYGSVARLMVLLQNAGAPSVGLMTEPPKQARK